MGSTLAPPANVGDLDETQLQAWSAVVSAWLDSAVDRVGGPRRGRFFNAARTPPTSTPAERRIVWDAFPRVITVSNPGNRAAARAAADEPADLGTHRFRAQLFQGDDEPVKLPFRRHDEYCEWFTDRDPATGSVRRFVFTCEGPEYWQFIAAGTAAVVDDLSQVPAESRVDGDRELLLRLYRELVGPDVREEDLFHQSDVYLRSGGRKRVIRQAGEYNPNNKWNTTHGLVHLTHPSNTLSAEIFLGADATVLRAGPDGTPVTDAGRLICCAEYGEPNRSSDPTIGADVNDLVRAGLTVSLRDPIGLYLDSIDTSGLSGPDGEDVSDWWRPVRGSGPLTLRAEFAPPAGATFGLADVRVNGVPLTRAGQLAELITMALYGIGFDAGNGAPQPQGCTGHGCSQVGNPDLLQIVAAGSGCPDGWTDAFGADDSAPAFTAMPATVPAGRRLTRPSLP
ncbi:hypothetical protein [Actinoplanes sp. NPDC026670]|uniref:hypothetical protein n=1 Tax=Actinoplanes sp. NPDC026670 TaxID=3154700 RepID=UPI0033E5AE64